MAKKSYFKVLGRSGGSINDHFASLTGSDSNTGYSIYIPGMH